jgi:hypothetical protein
MPLSGYVKPIESHQWEAAADFLLFPVCSHWVPIKFPKCFPSSQCVPQDASNCTAVVSYGKTWKTNKLEFFIFYVTDPGKAQNNKPRQSSLGGGYHLPQDINMESKTGHLSGAFVFYIGVTKLALW